MRIEARRRTNGTFPWPLATPRLVATMHPGFNIYRGLYHAKIPHPSTVFRLDRHYGLRYRNDATGKSRDDAGGGCPSSKVFEFSTW
jgi:hypothetical protein